MYKILVVGHIFLFVSVGIQPVIAVDVSNRINKNRDNLGDFEQLPYGPDESWIFRISDADAGYRVWDEYWELDSPISNTHWWGLSLVYPWANCDPEEMTFEIILWDQLLGNPVCTYHITPYEMPTGIYYNGAEMFQWEIELDPCCMQIPDGWISIQSIESPNNCWFYWAGSGDGDLYCYHEGATNPDCESDCAFKFQMYNPEYGKIHCDPIGMDFRRARPGTTITGQIYICNSGYHN